MKTKKTLFFFIFISTIFSTAAIEPETSYKFYGFVRNDLYFNSRQNEEAFDGLLSILPKPKEMLSDIDNNALPNSQMLAISSRLGIDLTGSKVFGAKTSAKIELDFAGVKAYYYLIRLRHAYIKFNWVNSELIVGQTWHPMFSNIQPFTPALSVGAPFQSFNRSPQIRFKQNLGQNFSLLSVASYQMQYLTQGPNGLSSIYMKNGLLPGLYLGIDFKAKGVLAGLGVDGKSLLINRDRLNSASAFAYAQYAHNKFQIRTKTVYGQNLSEYVMVGGYGVSGTKNITENNSVNTYTNFNTLTSWLSLAYGTKVQVGIYGGISQNLGTNKNLLATEGKYTAYGYGFYQGSQTQLDQLLRVAPNITFNISNIKLGFEYELTAANFGTIQSNGTVTNPYMVNNHRILATISYLF